MKTDCFARPIGSAFSVYGRFVSRHPAWFIVVPLVVAAALVSGLQFMKLEIELELLFTPEHGRAKTERSKIQTLFPDVSSENFTGIRLLAKPEIARLMVVAKDGSDLFENGVIEEVKRLDNIVRAISVEEDGLAFSYTDICAQSDDDCVPEPILMLLHDHNIHPRQLQYPVQPILVPNGPAIPVFLGSSLGGVSRSKTGELKAKAWQLFYPLNIDHKASFDWQNEFLQVLSEQTFTHIDVYRFTTHTVELSMNENANRVKPLFVASFGILLIFSIMSCLSDNWVRSKPWLATLGVVSAGLAVGSGFGLLMFFGVPFNDVVGSGALLVLGIGLDDMFVILAAWRHTDVLLPVETRMGIAFKEAGLSISITTLTNVLCLCVGAMSDLRAIRLFCLFSGVAIVFDYLFVLTFFAGCVVLTGRREAAGLHAFTCHKIAPKSRAGHRSAIYRLFCTGGYDDPEKAASSDCSSSATCFFRNVLGGALSPRPVKLALLHVYLIYLGLGLWGVSRIGQGLRMQRLLPDNSYSSVFVDIEGDYFSRYGPAVQVVVNTPLDLWRSTDLDKLTNLLDRFHEPDARRYFYSATEDSWPRIFSDFTTNKTLTASTVAKELDDFLTMPAYRDFRLDVGDLIEGQLTRCRLFVRMRDIDVREPDANAMEKARQIADETTELDVTVFHSSFVLADQFLLIVPSTVLNLGVATAAIFVVSLLLIPHPVCAFWVTLSVASVCAGVTGYMSWWGIDLDGIAMVLLLMCVGFSVDFSAHITYAFVIDDGDTGNQRMRNALGALGMPVVQGALSTILGMVVLSASTSYVFRTFFKVIFLVMVFGAMHGLVFLPVVLSLVGPSKPSPMSSPSSAKVALAPFSGRRTGSRVYSSERPRRSAQRCRRMTSSVVKATPIYDYNGLFGSRSTYVGDRWQRLSAHGRSNGRSNRRTGSHRRADVTGELGNRHVTPGVKMGRHPSQLNIMLSYS